MAAAIPWVIAAVSAAGAISQSNAQSAAAKTQSQMMDYNKEVDKLQAQNALNVSSAQQMQQQRAARQALGRQRAAAAQAKVGLGGTTEDLLDRSETLANLDQLNIAYEGKLRALGYTTQSEIDSFQSKLYLNQAAAAKTAGYYKAASSFASAFGSGYGSTGGSTTVGNPGGVTQIGDYGAS